MVWLTKQSPYHQYYNTGTRSKWKLYEEGLREKEIAKQLTRTVSGDACISWYYLHLSPSPPQHWFQVGTDSSRCVTCMVAYGQGVWLALQGSAQVRLYHAQTWESLTEVDVAPAVHKMLAGKHTQTAITFTGF